MPKFYSEPAVKADFVAASHPACSATRPHGTRHFNKSYLGIAAQAAYYAVNDVNHAYGWTSCSTRTYYRGCEVVPSCGVDQYVDPNTNTCIPKPGCADGEQLPYCSNSSALREKKQLGPQCPNCEKNPINAATGNKYQPEADYTSASGGPSFTRAYNSKSTQNDVLGASWRHNWQARLTRYDHNGAGYVVAERPDGQAFIFTLNGSAWTNESDIKARLTQNAAGYVLTDGPSRKETYDTQGRLLELQSDDGRKFTLTYSGSQLSGVADSFGRTLALSYNGQNRLATLTDPASGVTSYAYDAAGNLASVTYPGNKTRVYHYENASFPNALTGITDENGDRYATYAYDAQGRAFSTQHAGGTDSATLTYNASGTTTVTDGLGLTRTRSFTLAQGTYKATAMTAPSRGSAETAAGRTYDANGFLASTTDFNGNVTTYTHNSRGLEESRTEAYGTALARTITTQWHTTFDKPTQIDEPGRRTVHTYDATTGDRLTQTVTDLATSETRTTTWTYTALGRVETVNGPRTDVSDVTTYTYYACATGAECGQVHTITNAAGHVTEVTSYDDHGNPLTTEDANGVVTTLTYDLRQRLKTRTVSGATTTFDYDGIGQPDQVTLPDGSFLDYTYDAAHRLTDIEDNAGNRIHYTLDAFGNRTAEEVFDPADVLKRKQSQVFNTLGRLEDIKNAAGQVAQHYAYDNQGNRTSATAYDGASGSFETVSEFDALNRMWRSTAADSGVTQYGFNARDQLTGVTDPRSLTTTYVMNALGDVQELGSPDTGITGYEYDAAGNRTSQIDARGEPVAYSYDALDRLTFVDYAGMAEDVTYTYDSTSQSYGKGRLTGIQDASGTTTLIYDARGNVTQEQRVIGGSTYTTGYGHDSADRVTSITYPSGRIVTYVRNSLGQISNVTTTVGGGTTTLAQDIAYMPFGGVKSYTLGNGIVVTRSYDADYRLTAVTDQGSATVQNLGLTYDRIGNIKVRDDVAASVSQNFAYDELSRLTSATGSYGTQGFAYDDVGNRLTQTGTSPETYDYASGSHQLSSLGSGTSFSYDDAGNVTAKGTLSLTYNLAHRLATASVGGVTVTNTYGASGQRIKKLASGITTVFSYDRSGQLIAEQPDSGSAREYVWLESIPLAQASAAGLGYFHVDQLNTPQKMTDGAQTVVWQASYTPFGEATVTSSSGYDNPLRFPGQYFDTESGLHQNWMRDYDPSIGRYLQSDPIGLGGGLNTYGYVDQNPLSSTDPQGLFKNPGKIEDDAIADTKRRFPNPRSRWNGPGDAYRHCLASCEMSQENGQFMAWLLGDLNEKRGDYRRNQSEKEKDMDRWNNSCGNEIGQSGANCQQGCLRALQNGTLDAGTGGGSFPTGDGYWY